MRYVALLRGIGPLNPNMANANLRGVVEDLGFHNVESVVTSGNLIFDAESTDAAEVEARIEAAWPEHLGFRSTTIVRTLEQMQQLVAIDPFGDRADTTTSRLQVTFLQHEPDRPVEVPFIHDDGDYSIVATGDRVLFSVIDLTDSKTPELMRWLERTFGKQITMRTWKTVHRIIRKMS